MNETVEKIVTRALQTPIEDRAVIAERLISSLDAETDLETEFAGQEEIHRRITEVDRGDVVCIPWEVVQRRLSIQP